MPHSLPHGVVMGNSHPFYSRCELCTHGGIEPVVTVRVRGPADNADLTAPLELENKH
ncbi:uncharacterized protein BDR25DRAFT_361933 [Lindgomyces ingoldianus]|uniref:Uncharacterized protein n=1 Tax=Lindgomyces ingoldianus TaxID=673940 RepID=A0ACB6QCT8_9PLEO|nr:uncharacterized protein BDR25DRAFT_361933 [Lindgomyces ingoldianus]KAF2464187.1 hypothetical protein BDR25DRAFT_361933 [Lindgomyces ingoldianus]